MPYYFINFHYFSVRSLRKSSAKLLPPLKLFPSAESNRREQKRRTEWIFHQTEQYQLSKHQNSIKLLEKYVFAARCLVRGTAVDIVPQCMNGKNRGITVSKSVETFGRIRKIREHIYTKPKSTRKKNVQKRRETFLISKFSQTRNDRRTLFAADNNRVQSVQNWKRKTQKRHATVHKPVSMAN